MIEQTFRSLDGGVIGAALWGGRTSVPIFAAHGTPGSRYLAVGADAAEANDALIIGLDRPGFGRSSPPAVDAGWSWADDVAAVASDLGLERFAVVGASAGARHALACGRDLSERVSVVGVVAGVLPPDLAGEDDFTRLVAQDRPAAVEAAVEHFEVMAADIDGSVDAMSTRPGPDAEVYRRPDVRSIFTRARREAFLQGVGPAVADLLAINEPWGLDLAELQTPVVWWHGDHDPVTPIEAVRRATRLLPRMTLVECSDEGHALGFDHANSIISTLVQLHRNASA